MSKQMLGNDRCFQKIGCGLLALGIGFASLTLPAVSLAQEICISDVKVVMRKSTNTDSKALQSIPEGEELDLLGSSGEWYKVRYAGFTGYVKKDFVSVDRSTIIKQSEKIKALGNAPGIMRIGDNNTDVKKLQEALNILGYYNGDIDGKYGSGTTKAVEAYQADQKLEVDGAAGYETVSNLFGSCSKTSLTTQPNPGEKSTSSGGASQTVRDQNAVDHISDIGKAPAPSKEGDRGNDVIKLQQALECLGYYDGVIDGKYGEGTVEAVQRLQKKREMTADGIAGSSTIRVLFGSVGSSSSSSSESSSKVKTEVKSWFDDKVTNLIPKNARFTIKDVRTGKTFEAVRWSGYNHLDAEPRTAEDTATLKEISGGSFSWSRRPILIQYNGHVYAASMNTMPHGTSTIGSNNYEGHFCIHFEDSMTHESEKVDASHQNAVAEAGKASW